MKAFELEKRGLAGKGHSYLLSPEERMVYLQETADLFSRKRQGHLIHRCYMTSRALEFGGKFTTTPENYMRRAEIAVIAGKASEIAKKAQHAAGIIGIENGPGMESAIRSKSVQFFKQLTGLHTYYGRDLSSRSVEMLPDILSKEMPSVRVLQDQCDYLKTSLPSHLGKGRKVMAEFGMTRGNMEGFPENGFPYEIIKKDFVFHRRQMSEGDIYTFTLDCNQDGPSVEAAYNSEWTNLWARELVQTMLDELPIMGDFHPDHFDFKSIWNGASHCSHNYIVANRRMQFYLGRQIFTLNRGDAFGITNSYKMPVEYAEALAKDTGWDFFLYEDDDKRVPLCAYVAT